jgi:hypothetical protein
MKFRKPQIQRNTEGCGRGLIEAKLRCVPGEAMGRHGTGYCPLVDMGTCSNIS